MARRTEGGLSVSVRRGDCVSVRRCAGGLEGEAQSIAPLGPAAHLHVQKKPCVEVLRRHRRVRLTARTFGWQRHTHTA